MRTAGTQGLCRPLRRNTLLTRCFRVNVSPPARGGAVVPGGRAVPSARRESMAVGPEAGDGARRAAVLTTATARTIVDAGTVARGLAPQLAERLARAIRLGLIPDGSRLPPEAGFAEELGVATVTLRDTLAILRAEGLVVTRRGRSGGTFARAPRHGHGGALAHQLLAFTTLDLRELGDHRRAVSGTSAALAAERWLPADLDQLRRRLARLAAASTPGEYHRCETQFGIEVALAAQSPRLTGEELRLRAEVGDLSWLRSAEADRDAATASRRALVEAIARRDHGGARALAEAQVVDDVRRLIALRIQLYDTPAIGSGAAAAGEP